MEIALYIHMLITLYLLIKFTIYPSPDIVVFHLFWYPFIFNIDLSIIIIFQTRPSTILPWSMANPVSNNRLTLHLFHFILLSVITILPPTTIILYFSDKVKPHFTTVVLLSCIILLFQFCHPLPQEL